MKSPPSCKVSTLNRPLRRKSRFKANSSTWAAGLSRALNLALGTALLLAAGCSLYIIRTEGQNSSRYQEVLKARGALEQLSARLVDAQETERRTISRELHDQGDGERVGQLGGRFEIQSAPGKGTLLNVTIPDAVPAATE